MNTLISGDNAADPQPTASTRPPRICSRMAVVSSSAGVVRWPPASVRRSSSRWIVVEEHFADPRHQAQGGGPHQRQVVEQRRQIALGGEIARAAVGQGQDHVAVADQVAHRHVAQRDDRLIGLREPGADTQAFGEHRALGRAGAARGVEHPRQWIFVGRGDMQRRGRQRCSHARQRRRSFRWRWRCPPPASRRARRLKDRALVVVAGFVVEDDQPLRRGAGQGGLDGVFEIVDTHREDSGLGLGQDRRVLAGRCAGLQGHHHRTEVNAGAFDGRVVDAGESQHAHEVPGTHRMRLVMSANRRPRPCTRAHRSA